MGFNSGFKGLMQRVPALLWQCRASGTYFSGSYKHWS